MSRTAEIAGAGFAGLTAAIALARRGWRVRVHERADEVRTFGAGIFLWENGIGVLRELGADAAVFARCHEAPHWDERDHTGTLLGTRRLPGGLHMITLTRGDLLAALLERATDAGVRIQTGAAAVGADPAGSLRLDDGTRLDADLVVAADGIRSAVRDGLGVEVGHHTFDFGLYRLLVSMDRVPDPTGPWLAYTNFWNLDRRRRVLYVPCNSDDLYLLLGARVGDPALTAPVDPAVWVESFPVLAPVLAELPLAPRFDRYESVRLSGWSVGRVAVVGDAAHAMPPTIGQGAGTAMTNALALARHVDGAACADDVPAALAGWERECRPMTEHTQRRSTAIARTVFPDADEPPGDWDDDVLAVARNVPSPAVPSPEGGP